MSEWTKKATRAAAASAFLVAPVYPSAEMVTEAHQAEMTYTIAEYLNQGHSVEVSAYRLMPDAEKELLSDDEIKRRIGELASMVSVETQGTFRLEVGDDVRNIIRVPSGIDEETGQQCYTDEDIEPVVNDVKLGMSRRGEVAFIATNRTDVCRVGKDAISHFRAAGWAKVNDNYAFFTTKMSEREAKDSWLERGVALHEFGHILGLKHYGEIRCDLESDQYPQLENLMLRPIGEIVEDSACDFARNEEEDVNEYASLISAMGHNRPRGDSDERRNEQLLSTLDRIQLMPGRYLREEVPLTPASYSLSLGANRRNAIAIDLPADHPLATKLAEASTEPSKQTNQLVVSIEAIGTSDNPNLEGCDGRMCMIRITATSGDDKVRYQLEPVSGYLGMRLDKSTSATSSIQYIDETLGIGIVAHIDRSISDSDVTPMRHSAFVVEIVDYPTALKLMQQQSEDYRKYNEDMYISDMNQLEQEPAVVYETQQ